jgi:hypothetical protein
MGLVLLYPAHCHPYSCSISSSLEYSLLSQIHYLLDIELLKAASSTCARQRKELNGGDGNPVGGGMDQAETHTLVHFGQVWWQLWLSLKFGLLSRNLSTNWVVTVQSRIAITQPINHWVERFSEHSVIQNVIFMKQLGAEVGCENVYIYFSFLYHFKRYLKYI